MSDDKRGAPTREAVEALCGRKPFGSAHAMEWMDEAAAMLRTLASRADAVPPAAPESKRLLALADKIIASREDWPHNYPDCYCDVCEFKALYAAAPAIAPLAEPFRECLGCSSPTICEREQTCRIRLMDRMIAAAPAKPAEPIAAIAPDALTFDAFRLANVTRCVKWHPQGINSWSPSDWLTAVTGELGELASLLKMRNRERDGLPGNKFSPSDKQVADEIADVLTYLDLLAASLGVDLGRAATEKFNEVSERVGFPDRIGAS